MEYRIFDGRRYVATCAESTYAARIVLAFGVSARVEDQYGRELWTNKHGRRGLSASDVAAIIDATPNGGRQHAKRT